MRRGVWVLAGAALLVACQVLLGIKERHLEDDAGLEAGTDAFVDPCKTLLLPPRPDPKTSSTDDSETFTAALSKVDLGVTDGGDPTTYGFNLDQNCTPCSGAGGSCIAPTGDMNQCDNDAGVDLGGRTVFKLAQTLGFIQEDQFNSSLKSGRSGALIRVEKYNGLSDDAQVTISVYSSLGVEGDAGVLRDGTDKWSVDSISVRGGNVASPKATDANAYVSNHKLVTTLAFPVTVGGVPIVTLELSEGIIVADITPGPPRRLSGVLAGRWSASAALTSFQSFPDPQGGFLCGEAGASYPIVQKAMCDNVDIVTNAVNDNRGAMCDAVSIGIRFEAIESRLGDVLAHPDAAAPCGADWIASCP